MAIAVYKDAKEHKNNSAIFWTIAVLFFGILFALIYFICRYFKEKNVIICPHCGNEVSTQYPICMFCKQPVKTSTKRNFFSDEVKKYIIIAILLYMVDLIIRRLIV